MRAELATLKRSKKFELYLIFLSTNETLKLGLEIAAAKNMV